MNFVKRGRNLYFWEIRGEYATCNIGFGGWTPCPCPVMHQVTNTQPAQFETLSIWLVTTPAPAKVS